MTQEQLEIIQKLDFQEKEIKFSIKGNKYIQHIETEYANGGMMIFKFQIINPSKGFYIFNNNMEDVVWKIMKHPKLQKEISEIIGDKNLLRKPKITQANTFGLFGKLCGIAKSGGAYSSIEKKLTDTEVIEISKDFVKEFLPNSFEDYHYYQIVGPWTNWFYNIAWDFSAIIFTKQYDELNLICMTDTD